VLCQNHKSPVHNTFGSRESVIDHFSSLFSSDDYDIGFYPDFKFSIATTSEYPVFVPSRRVPLHLENKVNKMIDEMLSAGIIVKSTSPYNSPLVIVPKKDGNVRICVDFRALNKITLREQFHIPDSTEIFDSIGGHKFYSTIDLSKGYYQIGLDETSQVKTAFSTSKGHFQFTRLPFGLCGAPASFQKCLQQILRNEVGRICAVYIDDIIIYGDSKREHDQNLFTVLKRLKEAGLKVSRSKFVFREESVTFLGHVVSGNGLSTDPKKIEVLDKWPRPKNMKELNSFLGFVNYYRKFVPNFSHIIKPLEKISIKAKGHRQDIIEWTDELDKAFFKCKSSLANATKLHSPSKSGIFILDTDASNESIGGVLSQVDEKGVERPIFFASNRLSKTEQRYCTTRKELLAVVKYIKFFHHYLIGKEFIVRTDHRSLTWLLQWKMPSTSQYFSWLSQLQLYNFKILYRSGERHMNADVLSRLKWCTNCKIEHSMNCVHVLNNMDENPINKVKEILTNKVAVAGVESPEIKGLLKYKDKMFVKSNQLLINIKNQTFEVISTKQAHELIKNLHWQLCHIGAYNLYLLIKRKYFCLKLHKICQMITNTCLICLKRKVYKPKQLEKGSLETNKIFERVFIDIAGPLPSDQGFKYLLVMIDGFSNFISLSPLKNISSSAIATAFFDKWVSIFGPPEIIHSDNGLGFKGEEMAKICRKFSIRQSFSSPYHPAGNGKVERCIGVIKDMIYCCTTGSSKSWSEQIPKVEMAIRTMIRSEIGLSAHEILFGQQMRQFNNDTLVSYKEPVLEMYCKTINTKSNNRSEPRDPLEMHGKYVMSKILPLTHSIGLPRYEGPFKVTGVTSNGRCLKLQNSRGEEMVRNVKFVKPITQESFNLFNGKSNVEDKQFYEAVHQSEKSQEDSNRENQNQSLVFESARPYSVLPKARYPSRIHVAPTRFGFDA